MKGENSVLSLCQSYICLLVCFFLLLTHVVQSKLKMRHLSVGKKKMEKIVCKYFDRNYTWDTIETIETIECLCMAIDTSEFQR